MSIKAIETEYNGYRFRSRLEARWAIFFDALDVKYQYEPEGFELSDGTYYLPDFYLPDLHLFVEVKGVMGKEDIHKIEQFREDNAENALDGNCLWVVGDIPSEQELTDSCWPYSHYDYPYFSIDYDYPYVPCICPVCGKFGIEFDGRGGRVCGDKCTESDKSYSYDHPKIVAAYKKARQARFEHGETPMKGVIA